jgi:hypothetical protein
LPCSSHQANVSMPARLAVEVPPGSSIVQGGRRGTGPQPQSRMPRSVLGNAHRGRMPY